MTQTRSSFWLVSLLFLTTAGANAAPEWTPGQHESLDRRLAALVEEHKITGVALGLVASDDLVFAEGYGNAQLDAGRPIDAESVFHWASVSKPFVAIGIMQLLAAGELELESRLTDLLPYFEMADERYKNITVGQLMSHESGMPDVEDYEWGNPQTDDEALKRWALEQKGNALLFEPGSQRQYSNIGFELLGLVIQEVAGISFEDYMRERILLPVGMKNSSFIASEITPELRTSGHMDEASRRQIPAYPYNRRHAPSSTLNSNVSDMGLFGIALLKDYRGESETMLASSSLEQMWAMVGASEESPDRGYSLGWSVGNMWGGMRAAVHGGGDDGYRSLLYVAPDDGVVLVIASNDETIRVRDFAVAALETLFPDKIPGRQ